jgi:hypothetical protein
MAMDFMANIDKDLTASGVLKSADRHRFGYPIRTFMKKVEAEAWARAAEASMEPIRQALAAYR